MITSVYYNGEYASKLFAGSQELKECVIDGQVVWKKDYFKPVFHPNSVTEYGITTTINNDGSVTINGKATVSAVNIKISNTILYSATRPDSFGAGETIPGISSGDTILFEIKKLSGSLTNNIGDFNATLRYAANAIFLNNQLTDSSSVFSQSGTTTSELNQLMMYIKSSANAINFRFMPCLTIV